MAVCPQTTVTPNFPTSSSGHTAQLAAAAVRCDTARILERLRGGGGAACAPTPPNPRAAVYASVLEQDAATSCQITGPAALALPKRAMNASQLTLKRQQAVAVCANDQFNAATRFSSYVRVVPQAVCPPTPAEQLNSTAPKPTFYGCQPSRYGTYAGNF